MKRIFDIVFSLFGLLLLLPVFFIVMFLVWRQDHCSPLYIASRVGLNGKEFKMVKIRSMVINADKSGVESTSVGDDRITHLGHFIRRFKLDELSQLWNVLIGDMSLVGPRPNTRSGIAVYTNLEKRILFVKPGITDFSSIIFSDEGAILEGNNNPDIAYNQFIRPWKSRLGLIYIDHQSLWLDIQIIVMTVVAILSKKKATNWVVHHLEQFKVDAVVVDVCRRDQDLVPYPPPGLDSVVDALY